jgi:predicted small integral membrane protein
MSNLLTGLVAVKRTVLEMVYVCRINVTVWMVTQEKVVKLLYVLITVQTKGTVWITGVNVIKGLQVIITYRGDILFLSCLCIDPFILLIAIWIFPYPYSSLIRGCRGRSRMVVGFPTTTYVISLSPLSSNPAHGKVKFVMDLQQVSDFFPCTPVSSTNKTDLHDINEILL